MNTLLIISTILCFGYIIVTKILTPSLTCISETWYHYKYGFTAWCWASAFTVLPIMLEKTETENWQFLGFLSCTALMVLGMFPRYQENEKIQHYTCALIAGLLAIIWTMFFTVWWAGLVVLVILVGVYFILSLWYTEVLGLLTLYILLFLF